MCVRAQKKYLIIFGFGMYSRGWVCSLLNECNYLIFIFCLVWFFVFLGKTEILIFSRYDKGFVCLSAPTSVFFCGLAQARKGSVGMP